MTEAAISYETVNCAYCQGAGSLGKEPCRACDGQGSVLTPQPPRQCVHCQGKGKKSAYRCNFCRGSGWAHALRQSA